MQPEQKIKEREVSAEAPNEERAFEFSLRPQNLREFVGQPKLKENLEILIGAAKKFLKETQEMDLILYEDSIIGVKLPPKVDLKIIQAPPGVKGDTATGGKKAAVLETGATINVPLFINEGEIIRVNTETEEYAERISDK